MQAVGTYKIKAKAQKALIINFFTDEISVILTPSLQKTQYLHYLLYNLPYILGQCQ